MSTKRLSEIVDLDRYPIADLAPPQRQTVVATCRKQLLDTGLCLLPGFVRADAVAGMVAEAQALAPKAHRTEHWRATPHGDGSPQAGTIPRETRAAMRSIAYDLIGRESGLRALYESCAFTGFLRAALDNDALYPCADPLVNCIMTICRDGDELGWHYDPNDGVVSLLLQPAEQGGGFEFVPDIRGRDPAATERELAVLEGRDDGVLRPRLAPGTLSLFNGHRSLHRVAPVGLGRERIIALFSYAQTPGYVFSPEIRENFFGRHN
ncbi:MAG TPA: 2OG-Fe(II) oxygenase [Thermohalobaculum sp.]|nr:2OG-Fe(II) oxygenase [Thermohalobaculum sp.]